MFGTDMRWFYCLIAFFVSQVSFAKVPVVLISIDGFAQHYIEKYKPKNILALAEQGVIAKAMYPVFPSKTFPNHLSIVTGVYPAQHGIVHNKFYHRALKENYTLGAGRLNSAWLTARPIWTLAEQNGLISAIYFWPESETKVDGILPTYYFPYEHNTPNRVRIDKVVDWLKLPKTQRPDFIASYFSTVDSAGHRYGHSPELAKAIFNVDEQIGYLVARIKKEVNTKVNIILVSDHGMTPAGKKHEIYWKKVLTADQQNNVVNGQTQLYVYQNDSKQLSKIRSRLLAQPNFKDKYQVYLKNEYPTHWHFESKSSTIPDMIVNAIPPYTFFEKDHYTSEATHGYDAKFDDKLNAIFIANGPDFKANTTIEAFQNTGVFSLLTYLLKIKAPASHQFNNQLIMNVLKEK